jgi:pimeloyl-ACP methyl ester carboxylesterase
LRLVPTILVVALTGTAPKASRAQTEWQDPSPHTIQFVTVDTGVRLEVLDWGGAGPAVVLLAGSGHSAHVFDEFAPKLTGSGHVYGVTRRGWGASSQPATGYDNQRLSDDVLEVLNSLKLDQAVLVGHSAAGHEMTTVARQHTDRVAGLVYLDALGEIDSDPVVDAEWLALQQQLPPSAPRAACPQNRTSFAAFRASRQCTMGFSLPESEFRSTFTTNPDGSVGPFKTPQAIHRAMGAGHQMPRDYSNIRGPVLALFEFPRTSLNQLRAEDPQPRNDEERALVLKFAAVTKRIVDRAAEKLIRKFPDARLVDLPGAGHYVFITKEDEVLREIAAFLAKLR